VVVGAHRRRVLEGGRSRPGRRRRAALEIEPVGNKVRPPFVSSCQGGQPRNATLDTALSVGRVNEPLDLLRKRRVDTDSTPGWGTFDFVPGGRRPRHAVFLRAARTWSNVGSATTGSASP
jgi:hypothetical protein